MDNGRDVLILLGFGGRADWGCRALLLRISRW
jgi:hypothetical protein